MPHSFAAKSESGTAVASFTVGKPIEEAPVGSGLARLDDALRKLSDEITRLEQRLESIVSPTNDLPGDALASVKEPRSPLADTVHSAADSANQAAFRLEQLHNRVEL